MGKHGNPPDYYFEIEAANVLRMSFLGLRNHPDRSELLSIAASYLKGKSDGEYLLHLNPEFNKTLKDRTKKISDARK